MLCVVPEHLEYSEKDDKFRLITNRNRFGNIINLSKIVSCEYCEMKILSVEPCKCTKESCVTLMLYDKRNTLERVMLHFSHFKKDAVRLDDCHCKLKINYSKRDETELVIQNTFIRTDS